jgi:hypothetical protein
MDNSGAGVVLLWLPSPFLVQHGMEGMTGPLHPTSPSAVSRHGIDWVIAAFPSLVLLSKSYTCITHKIYEG